MAKSRPAGHSLAKRSALPHRRSLQFEPLERRDLLSITVDTLIDENDGVGIGTGTSLREAIAAAAPGDTINFAVTGTINLTVGPSNSTKHLTIDKSLTISGPGANLLTIKAFDPAPTQTGSDGSRAFNIDDGNPENLVEVVISGLTITGGDTRRAGGGIATAENLEIVSCAIVGNTSSVSPIAYEGGGGIFSNAGPTLPNSLIIRNSTISGNTALNAEGGGVRKRYGSVLLESCIVSSNTSPKGGGLSAADGNVAVTIHACTFATNNSTNQGGGIFVFDAKLDITSSTLSGNTANTGGGLYSLPFFQGQTSLTDCVITGNSARQCGGGIAAYQSLLLTRCEIVGNSAAYLSFGGGVYAPTLVVLESAFNGNSADWGGAIYSRFMEIVNSAISGNSAQYGGAITNSGGRTLIRSCTAFGNSTLAASSGAVVSRGNSNTSTEIQSSIIAGNVNGDVAIDASINTFVSLGYNLIGTGSALPAFNQTGDQTGILDPKLGPLVDNGGPTKTHALLPGSPAIDAGDPSALSGIAGTPLFDQRGMPYTRVFDADGVGGGRIDIGAYELQSQPLPATVFGDFNSDGLVDAADYVVWRKFVGATVPAYTSADGSGNGAIGVEDYDVWRAHFAMQLSVSPAATFENIALNSHQDFAPVETLAANSSLVADAFSNDTSMSFGKAAFQRRRSSQTDLRLPAYFYSAEYDDALLSSLNSASGRAEEHAADASHDKVASSVNNVSADSRSARDLAFDAMKPRSWTPLDFGVAIEST